MHSLCYAGAQPKLRHSTTVGREGGPPRKHERPINLMHARNTGTARALLSFCHAKIGQTSYRQRSGAGRPSKLARHLRRGAFGRPAGTWSPSSRNNLPLPPGQSYRMIHSDLKTSRRHEVPS